MLDIQSSRCEWTAANPPQPLGVCFKRGFRTILVTDPQNHPYIESWWPPGHIIGYEHTFVHTVYDLLAGIEKNESPRPNFEDGVRNQKVLAAWERSAATRRWESV